MPPSVSPSQPGPGESLDEGAAPAAEAGTGSELPLERSRFSHWLARFGLGESTLPLLRPPKSSRPGGRR